MGSLKKMVSMAVEATGDGSISVAGDFQPKGMVWKQASGAIAGSVVGDVVSGGDAIAELAGMAAGVAAGTLAAGEANSKLPTYVVLAASPEKLYVLTRVRHKGELLANHLKLLHVMERAGLVVTLGDKTTVRTAIVEDAATNFRLELEGVRYGAHATDEILDELGKHQHTEAMSHPDELPAEEAD